MTQDRLMKTNPVDRESQKIIKERDDEDEKALEKHRLDLRQQVKEKEEEAERKKLEVKKAKPGKGRIVTTHLMAKFNRRKLGKRKSALKNLRKLQKMREKDKEIETILLD